MRVGVSHGGLVSPSCSVEVNDMPAPSHDVELVFTRRHGHHSHVPQASVARHLHGVISHRPRAMAERMEDRHECFEEYRSALHKGRQAYPQTRLVQLSREPIPWVDTARYLGVTVDTRLTWSPYIDQVRKRADQILGVLDPLHQKQSSAT